MSYYKINEKKTFKNYIMGKQIFCSQDNYHTINAHKRTSWSNVDDRLYIENNLTLFYLIENHALSLII